MQRQYQSGIDACNACAQLCRLPTLRGSVPQDGRGGLTRARSSLATLTTMTVRTFVRQTPGRKYDVRAEVEGQVQTRTVNVRKGRAQDLAIHFPPEQS